MESSEEMFDYVAIGRDAWFILARRVGTWVAPYVEQVGSGVLNWALALTVSCCLRQPRIASGAIRFFHILFFHLSFFLSY